jgi:ubiquinone/menaquinone biosynthesis C-methylase UbiE
MTETAWDAKLDTSRGYFGSLTYWLAHPVLSQLYGRRASPGAGDWVSDAIALASVGSESPPRLVSIGCGAADMELGLLRSGCISHLTTVDPSNYSFEAQCEKARGFPASWHPIQGTAETLHELAPALQADIVVFNMALHHCDDVNQALRNSRKVLAARNGLIVVNEYVGPPRFDFGERDRSILEAMFQTIPLRYRKLCVEPFTHLLSFAFPDPIAVLAADSTEAPQSDRIRPGFHSMFEVVKDVALPGTFFQFGVNNLIGNFATDDPEATAILLRLFQQESEYFSESSHFRLMLGKLP